MRRVFDGLALDDLRERCRVMRGVVGRSGLARKEQRLAQASFAWPDSRKSEPMNP
jgi:hypothetical protein